MKTDLTLLVKRNNQQSAGEFEKKVFSGHYGTHFDVMNKVFPLEYTELDGIVFDVKSAECGEIGVNNIDIEQVKENMFVAFASRFIEREGYGTQRYFHSHPTLSVELIEALIRKRIAIIGVDFAGVRRGAEHTPMDQYCADNGVFIIENLCNLHLLLKDKGFAHFHAHTYPVNFADMTGLPCRVIADYDMN